MVDSGKNGHGARIKSVMDLAGVSRIDFFVNTHYHEDHYGGVDDLVQDEGITVVNSFDRGEKDELDCTKRNQVTFTDYQAALGNNAAQLTHGQTIPLDPQMTVTCIASGGIVIGEQNPVIGVDENDKSVALLIEFEDFRYFVGGDIELTTEGKIAQRDLVLDVEVYQANHHGSHTSSSQAFMEDLLPSVVVISNGNHGGHQHPRQQTLTLLAGLSPAPTVFQTNKYFKGGAGGNVVDEFIADPQSMDQDGTILVTVSSSTGQYTVTYPDASHTFAIKPRDGTAAVVIESLLPNPIGNDRMLEEVTVRNSGSTVVSLASWTLRDKSGHAMSLTSLGDIAPGQSLTIRRNGMAMSLNNNGDIITLFGPSNQPRDSFSYTASTEGQRIVTGH